MPAAKAKALKACVEQIAKLPPLQNSEILLAVSGGPDSMAMAVAFREWQKEKSIKIRALVVDHGLRAESAKEAELAKSQLEKLGISTKISKITTSPPKGGIQAWARKERYQYLVKEAAETGAIIVTAHHASDQAETIAMRLSNQSGLLGLAGIAQLSNYKGVSLARPFIEIDKETLRDCLKGSGIEIVLDPSNQDERFERIRWRNMLPLLEDEGISNASLLRLGRTAETLKATMHKTIAAHMAGHLKLSPLGFVSFEREVFARMPTLAGEMLLNSIIRYMGASHLSPKKAAISRLRESLLQGKVRTLGGCEWRHTQDKSQILVIREAERLPSSISFAKGEKWLLFDNRWHIYLPNDMLGGEVSALGSKGFAELRSKNPDIWAEEQPFLARGFWSVPVLKLKGNHSLSAQAHLEDGGIIPYLYSSGTAEEPLMRFTGEANPAMLEAREKGLSYE